MIACLITSEVDMSISNNSVSIKQVFNEVTGRVKDANADVNTLVKGLIGKKVGANYEESSEKTEGNSNKGLQKFCNLPLKLLAYTPIFLLSRGLIVGGAVIVKGGHDLRTNLIGGKVDKNLVKEIGEAETKRAEEAKAEKNIGLFGHKSEVDLLKNRVMMTLEGSKTNLEQAKAHLEDVIRYNGDPATIAKVQSEIDTLERTIRKLSE
jgi:hypothetical protein